MSVLFTCVNDEFHGQFTFVDIRLHDRIVFQRQLNGKHPCASSSPVRATYALQFRTCFGDELFDGVDVHRKFRFLTVIQKVEEDGSA